MPKIPQQTEIGIRRSIRDALAVDPLISLRQIQKIVERKMDRTFDLSYIARLRDKVQKEVAVRADPEKVSRRVAIMREDFRIARENLLRIAYAQPDQSGARPPTHKDQIAAWKAIGMLSKLLLDAEMDLGIFDRHAPTDDDLFRQRTIPSEIFDVMLKTAQVWRLPGNLTRQIEPGGPSIIDTKEVPGKPPDAPGDAIPPEKRPDKLPPGLQQTHATINFEPQPDGSLKRIEPKVIIDPSRLIPNDPEFRVP